MDKQLMREALGISPQLLAIDPAGCGCLECIIGEYMPMDDYRFGAEHVFGMALGILTNNTGYPDPEPVQGIEFAWRTYTL